MKSLILALVLGLTAPLANAALTLRTEGRLISRTKKQIVFETKTIRYHIDPTHKKGQLFEMQKINANYYTLVADVRRIKKNKVIKKAE